MSDYYFEKYSLKLKFYLAFIRYEISPFGNNLSTKLQGMKKMYNKVEICNVNTNKLPVLKESEKDELLKLVKQGDMNAREKLIGGNLRLVLSVIQKFTNRGENMDDLFQIGCIGLIKAIDNFDPIHEVKFSTYAVPTVIECRNIREDFDYYDPKNRITKGNFATFGRQKEYRNLREIKRHFRGYAAYQLDRQDDSRPNRAVLRGRGAIPHNHRF